MSNAIKSRLAAIPAVVLTTIGTAQAALPEAVGTAVGDAKTDMLAAVGLVIGAMVAVLVRMYLRRKSGDPTCSSGCSGCSSAGSCGAYQPPTETERNHRD